MGPAHKEDLRKEEVRPDFPESGGKNVLEVRNITEMLKVREVTCRFLKPVGFYGLTQYFLRALCQGLLCAPRAW